MKKLLFAALSGLSLLAALPAFAAECHEQSVRVEYGRQEYGDGRVNVYVPRRFDRDDWRFRERRREMEEMRERRERRNREERFERGRGERRDRDERGDRDRR